MARGVLLDVTGRHWPSKRRKATGPHVKHVAPEFCRPVGDADEGGALWTVVASKHGQDKGQAPVQHWIVDPLAGGVTSAAQATKRISEGSPLQATIVVALEQAEVDKLVSLARRMP